MMIKNIIFSLCVFTSFQLVSMEIEPYKKSNDDYGLTKHYCLVREMQGYGDTGDIRIPKEVADIIILQSYLIRKNEVYKNFDPFFHFNNDGYHKMHSDWCKNKDKFIKDNPGDMGDDDFERFRKLYPYNIHLCRKFDIIEPDDLIFFTKKQDAILSSLLLAPRLKPFHTHQGSFSLQLNKEDNEQYEMLPCEFKKKIEEKYPKFLNFKCFE
jgi:hypothetical protein